MELSWWSMHIALQSVCLEIMFITRKVDYLMRLCIGSFEGLAAKCFPAAQRNEKDEFHFSLILLPSDSILLAKYLK